MLKNIFGKLICEELELVKNCIKTAKSCKENTGFTLYEAFVEIAGTSRYICEQNLFEFFRKNNIIISYFFNTLEAQLSKLSIV